MVTTVLFILFVHFVADFICQTDGMATNKSKSLSWLTIHVCTYTPVLLAALGFWGMYYHIPLSYMWYFGIVNGALHWVTDFFTSKLNYYLWKKEMRHWFFVGIGADQFIHYTCLLITYDKMIGF